MKKLLLLSFLLFYQNATAAEAWQTFSGAWFTVEYPANFRAEPGLTSESSEGVDTAWFVSPDGAVAFYICSPQWSREPSDFSSAATEKQVSAEHKGGPEADRETWWSTYQANDGSYAKSLVVTREHSAKWAIGLRYRDQASLKKYRPEYLHFKQSLKQFAD